MALPLRRSRSSPMAAPVAAAAVALAAVWVYRRALTFAFFNDDPTGHFAWMEGRSVGQFFVNSAEYGYYRPVVFTVLRLLETLAGGHNAALDHALLLLLHGANVALVWALAYRLSRRSTAFATAAALVFAAVPFSYEAVAYVASLTHPLLVFWALISLLAYDRWRRRGGWPAFAVALLALALGLLTHENGLFIVPAMLGVEWVNRGLPSPAAIVRDRLWVFAAPPLLYLALWLAVPKNSEQSLNGLAAIGRNAVPFLQTLVYPLLPLARLDAGEVGWLAALAALVLTATGLLAWRAAALRLWAFALGWLVLSALPSLLFLSPAYVYGSPRLSYLPSIGAALLWAIPVLWLWRVTVRPRGRAAAAVVTTAYVAAIILPPQPFVACQLDFYDETSRIARAMGATAGGAPIAREVVFVNAPFFFSSYAARPDGCPSPYPWTPVGGILIPPYAQARDFVRFNGGPDRPVNGITYPGYAPGWRTFGPEVDDVALREAAAADHVFVFDLSSGQFRDLSAAWRPGEAAGGEAVAAFGETLDLTGTTVAQDGDWLNVDLTWRVTAAPDQPLSAFVHVYAADGSLAAQHDGPPGDGLAPPALWQAGDVLADARVIALTGLPPGRYTVAAGLYQSADGQRLAVRSAAPVRDDAVLISEINR